jgi:hypothetical protein
MNTSIFVRAAIVVAGLSLLGAGCNPFARVEQNLGESVAEGAIERAIGGDADVDIGTAKLQENFPSDVPRYPNANYLASIIQKEGGYAIANFTTSDEMSDIADWFDIELKKEGFELDTDMSFGGLARVYQKDGVAITLQIQGPDDESNETTVSIQRLEESAN